jgi:hypothetical protein
MANPKIPAALGKSTVIFKNGDTNDIMSVMKMGEARFPRYSKGLCKWAKHNFEPSKAGLQKLWKYVREEIEYKVDPKGKQLIKTPPALVELGVGDCKSKTLFINAVLKCLGVSHFTRYVSYKPMNATSTHVYTIAMLGKEKIIIDSVYSHFNKQAPYTYKKDLPMAEISFIEGVPTEQELQTLNNGAYCHNKSNLTPIEEAYLEGKAEGLKRIETVRQKQAYVPKFENIPFNKLSDGQASLKIIERELKIIQAMKPELAKQCEKGLNMINKAIKGNYCIDGNIDKELYRYANKIQVAKNKIRPGNSFGIVQKRINALSKVSGVKCVPRSAFIGAVFPSRQCLNGTWFEADPQRPGVYAPGITTDQNGNCRGQAYFYDFLLEPSTTNTVSFTSAYRGSINNTAGRDYLKQNLYYAYGRDTDYRVNFNDFGLGFRNTLAELWSDGVLSNFSANGSYQFNTQNDFNLTMEKLNQASGVKSNWLNSSFSTDDAGTLGSGMFYSFANQIDPNISGFVAENNLPVQVQIKKSLQDSYLNSCVNFSGGSFDNVQDLARLGIIYDTGEQPEKQLGELWNLSQNSNISGHYVGEPITVIVAGIAAAIVMIVAAIGKAVAVANMAAYDAKNIDSGLQASSQFNAPNINQGPNGADWPIEDPNGGGAGGGSSNLLPFLLAAGAGYVALKDD